MIARRVADGRDAEFEQWASELTRTAAEFPGFLGSGMLRPGQTGQPWHVIYRFDTSENLANWERSSARSGVLAQGEHLVAETSVHRVSGLETWFSLPGRMLGSPPRWKMFLVSGACIFLLQFIVYTILGPAALKWPLAVRLAVGVTVVSALMTWAVMPAVARLLSAWFYPTARPPR